MMIIKIPQNQKFKKFNRSTCFNNNKLIRLVKNKTLLLRTSCHVGLIANQKSILTFNQLKMIFQIIAKHVKIKRNKTKKNISKSSFNLFKMSFNNNLNIFKNIRNLFLKKKLIKNFFFSSVKEKKKINRNFKKKNFSLLIQPRFPVTGKPLGIRMGKGKGLVSFWQTPIKKGQVIVLFRKDINFEKIFNSLIQVQKRIPFKTKIVCY